MGFRIAYKEKHEADIMIFNGVQDSIQHIKLNIEIMK